MEASTASAIASSVSAIVGAVSATIAAMSARNSRRSAQASEAALRETRHQRQADDARRQLEAIGVVHDDAMAFVRALAMDLRREPAVVERWRSTLRRSAMISGLVTPGLTRLLQASQPLEPAEVEAIHQELTLRSATLHRLLTSTACGTDPAIS